MALALKTKFSNIALNLTLKRLYRNTTSLAISDLFCKTRVLICRVEAQLLFSSATQTVV